MGIIPNKMMKGDITIAAYAGSYAYRNVVSQECREGYITQTEYQNELIKTDVGLGLTVIGAAGPTAIGELAANSYNLIVKGFGLASSIVSGAYSFVISF